MENTTDGTPDDTTNVTVLLERLASVEKTLMDTAVNNNAFFLIANGLIIYCKS